MHKQVSYKKYILVVVDAFSKFVQLYSTKTTNSSEVVSHLTRFSQCYSTPKVLISDRGSSFTSVEFEDFLKKYDIRHVKIATGSPQANGQVEWVNRVFTPMIAKLSDHTVGPQWYRILGEIEHSINNTVNKSTGCTPSQLVFGMHQRGSCSDRVQEFVSDNINLYVQDIDHLRSKAADFMVKAQQSQKEYYNQRHKALRSYQVGDLVMIKNFDSTPGTSKKLIPQFRGPYEIRKVLGNHRYLIADSQGFQNSQKQYTDVWAANNMCPWLKTAS